MGDVQRINMFVIVIGFIGTGKSTIAKKFLLEKLKKPGGRALVILPDDMEQGWDRLPEVSYKWPDRMSWYTGARRLIYYDGCLKDISTYFHNGLLIFDDCKSYLDAFTDKSVQTVLARRRHYNLDIIAMGHGFTEIPPKFFTFASQIILFKTHDNIDSRKKVIQDYNRMLQTQLQVNKKAKDNPHHYQVIDLEN